MRFSGSAERDCKEPLKNNPYMGVSWMKVLLWTDRNDGRKQSDLLGKATYAFLLFLAGESLRLASQERLLNHYKMSHDGNIA